MRGNAVWRGCFLARKGEIGLLFGKDWHCSCTTLQEIRQSKGPWEANDLVVQQKFSPQIAGLEWSPGRRRMKSLRFPVGGLFI